MTYLEVLLPLCLAVRGKIVPNDSAPGKNQFLLLNLVEVYFGMKTNETGLGWGGSEPSFHANKKKFAMRFNSHLSPSPSDALVPFSAK